MPDHFLMDTSILIEHQRDRGSLNVKQWLRNLPAWQRWVCPISIGECIAGLGLVSDPRLRLRERRILLDELSWRFAPIDCDVARVWGSIAKECPGLVKRHTNDSWIAAIAARRGFIVATANSQDFTAFQVPTFNPF